MTKLAENKLNEAEALLEDAEIRAAKDDPYSASLAIVYATHATILGVDVLAHLNDLLPAKRHDDAPQLYRSMIVDGLLPAEAAVWRELLRKAIQQRSKYQYDGDLAGRGESRAFVRNVAGFIAFVRGYHRQRRP